MPASRKFDSETRERAVRMYRDRLRDHDESKRTARRHVGGLLDINPETLWNGIERDAVDTGRGPGITTEASAEIKQLRKEIAELRRASETLKTASASFAQAEVDRRLR